MRQRLRAMTLLAAVALVAAGCSDDGGNEEPAGDSASPTALAPSGAASDAASGQALPDPNDQVEDGVYRGSGVVLPVPEGWRVDPASITQGIVAATSEDGTQQMTAQAIDTSEAEAAGQPLELDSLLDSLRQQIPQEASVDEEVELAGADRAHRLTWLDLPAQQEGGEPSSATIVIAENAERVGEFVLAARGDAYDEANAELLLAQAGFDADSSPPPVPEAPAPQGTPTG